MNRITLPLSLALAVSLLGCSGSTPATPSDTAPENTPASVTVPTVTDAHLGSPMGLPDAPLMPAALWTLDIDPTTLTASVRSSEERAAVAMGDTYLLDIAHYFARTPLAVTQVERVFDRLRVRYTITHPIPPASDLDAPASATNRADLGVTGITMFLVDAKPEQPVYFAESDRPIRANPTLIPNADGYFFPGAMVNTGSVANAFPYRRLVDDSALGSRLGQLNTILGVGNFGVQTGWQRNTIGDDHLGWTGFGALHQGQTSENAVEFLLDEVGTSPISLQVALIVRYTNPVGGSTAAERIANRLPPVVKDPAKFMYRMPQGAWDLERIAIEAIDGELNGREASQHALHLRVVDWDAKATETTYANLREEPLANRVKKRQSGLPSFSLSIPNLLGFTPIADVPGTDVLLSDDSDYGGDIGSDSGRADDPLYFRLFFERDAVQVSEADEYTCLLRVKDAAEQLTSDTALDAQLAPLVGMLPRIEAFQSFTMQMTLPPLPISITVLNQPVASGTKLEVAVEVTSWPTDPYRVQFDWENDGIWEATTYMVDPSLELASPDVRKNHTEAPLLQTLRVSITNFTTGAVEERIVAYTLGPNRAPTGWATVVSDRQTSPATFRLSQVFTSDPEGDERTYTVINDVTDEVIHGPDLIMNHEPIIAPPNGLVTFTVFLNDPLHPGAAGTPLEPIVCQVDPSGIVGWHRVMGETALIRHYGALEIDAAGNLYCFGQLRSPRDFGGGILAPIDASGMFLISYGPDMTYRWGRVLDSTVTGGGTDNLPLSMTVSAAGKVTIGLETIGPIDFGAGERPADLEYVYYVQYDATGAYLLDFSIGTWLYIYPNFDLDTGPADEVVASGQLGSTGVADFGGGPRPYDGPSNSFVVKHDAQGVYQWDRVYTGGTVQLRDVSIASDGAIYTAGIHGSGSANYGGGPRTADGSAGVIVALTSNGEYRWDRLLDGPGTGQEGAYACLATEAVPGVLVGGYANASIDLGNGTGAAGGFLVQLGPDGGWLWETRGMGHVREMVEIEGAIMTGGLAPGGIYIGPQYLDFDDGNDMFAASFTTDGEYRWGTVWPGPANEGAELFAATSSGDLFMSGYYESTFDLDPGPRICLQPNIANYTGILFRIDGDTGLF